MYNPEDSLDKIVMDEKAEYWFNKGKKQGYYERQKEENPVQVKTFDQQLAEDKIEKLDMQVRHLVKEVEEWKQRFARADYKISEIISLANRIKEAAFSNPDRRMEEKKS